MGNIKFIEPLCRHGYMVSNCIYCEEMAALRARVEVLEKDMSEMVAAVPHIGCHDKKNPCAKCFLISELRRRAK